MIAELEIAAALDLFEAAPCAYVFAQLDGAITRINQTFLDWTRYRSDQLVGKKRFQDLLSKPASIFYETHFSPLLRMQGSVSEIALDVICADGSVLPVLVNSKIHSNVSGRPALLLITAFDMRDRRRYEQELLLERRKAEQLAMVVEHATDAILAVDAHEKITSWNRGAENLFGYPHEAVGKSFRELLVPAGTANAFNAAMKEVRSGNAVTREFTLRHQSGSSLEVSASITPHIEPVDEFTGFSTIIRDLRARKEAESAQRMARDLELVNRVAHEVNNPLQIVVNCLAILSDTGSSEYVDMAQENLARIAEAIRRLVKATQP